MSIQKTKLHCPDLEEVAQVLQKGVAANFLNAQVRVVDCPDLTQKPWKLADKGLCGSECLAEVGGVTNLVPFPNRDAVFDLETLAEQTNSAGAFILGAAAGPAHQIGTNCELIANMCVKRGDTPALNKSQIANVNTETGGCDMIACPGTEYMMAGNFFLSEGKPGKVIEVRASKRTGPQNMMFCLRETLRMHYGEKPVGLGGTFLVETGKVKMHIMPDFAPHALTHEDLIDWAKYYEMSGPLVCVGHVVSHDPGLKLRLDHFHCFSDHGDGGHYHYDVTPDDVSYLGYFNIGHCHYRIDPA